MDGNVPLVGIDVWEHAFFSGVLFLMKHGLADQVMVSLVLVLCLTFIYWYLFLRCEECGAHLYSEKPCDNCGRDVLN